MIIEEEKKVEIIDTKDVTENTDKTTFNPISNKKNSSHHVFLIISIFLVIFLCLIIILFGLFTFYNYKNVSKITKGIFINGIDVSNLT